MTDNDPGIHPVEQSALLADCDRGELLRILRVWNRRLGQHKAHALITVEEAQRLPESNLRKAVDATGDYLTTLIVNVAQQNKHRSRK